MPIGEHAHVRIFHNRRFDSVNCLLAPNEYLLVAMEKEIRPMSMQPHGLATSAPWRAITNLSMVVGIDFDYRDKQIFYT